jgi:hypothetical protein
MPSFCAGGLLVHPCSDITPAHSHDNHSQEPCEHETDCDFDPCSIITTRSDELDINLTASIVLEPALAVKSLDTVQPECNTPFLLLQGPRLGLVNIPFPSADIPLLI